MKKGVIIAIVVVVIIFIINHYRNRAYHLRTLQTQPVSYGSNSAGGDKLIGDIIAENKTMVVSTLTGAPVYDRGYTAFNLTQAIIPQGTQLTSDQTIKLLSANAQQNPGTYYHTPKGWVLSTDVTIQSTPPTSNTIEVTAQNGATIYQQTLTGLDATTQVIAKGTKIAFSNIINSTSCNAQTCFPAKDFYQTTSGFLAQDEVKTV